jgi:protein-S-isoprenylcysteine O-methyltransferase Ste14
MRQLELRIPPLAVLLLFGVIAIVLARVIPTPTFRFPGAGGVAAIVAAIGTAFAVLGVVEFRRARTTVNPTQPGTTSRIVATGVYKLSRNPMYLGFALLLLALAVWLSHTPALLTVPAYMLYMNRFQIVPEERALIVKFGHEFATYMQTVRRWI